MRLQILTFVILGLMTLCQCFPKNDEVNDEDRELLDQLYKVLREYKQTLQKDNELNSDSSSLEHDDEQSRGYPNPPSLGQPVAKTAHKPYLAEAKKDNQPPGQTMHLPEAKKDYQPPGQTMYDPPSDEDAKKALVDYLRQKLRSSDPVQIEAPSNPPVPSHADNPNPPDVSKRYMELVSRVVNDINERFEAMEAEEREHVSRRSIDSPGAALRSFNAPSQRTRDLIRSAEQTEATLDAIALLTSSQDVVEELRSLEIFNRLADPHCTVTIDCANVTNLVKINQTAAGVTKEYQNITGTCNNIAHAHWGSANAQHQRLLDNVYDNNRWNVKTKTHDGSGTLPHVRTVSENVHSVTGNKADNNKDISLALFYFMQFIDHDVAKTPDGDIPASQDCCGSSTNRFCLPIRIGAGDSYFADGTCINVTRSAIVDMCHDSRIKNQVNEITSFIDASMVYGSSKEEMNALRTHVGGRLIDRTERTLPRIDDDENPGSWACNVSHEECNKGGDKRLNVHAGLLSFHTMFLRLHNIIAKTIADGNLTRSDDSIFYEARKIVAAIIQHITYNEMLPMLFTSAKLQEYNVSTPYVYNSSINPSMLSVFSIGYRYHHLMPHALHMFTLDDTGTPEPSETVDQELAIMKPNYTTYKQYHGLSQVSLGMVNSLCPHIDGKVNDAARNRLFLTSDGASVDLAAINILRGREWGLPGYNAYRKHCNLAQVSQFSDLTGIIPDDTITKLSETYAHVDDIDLWTGLVSEIPLGDSLSGETQTCLLLKHFHNLKFGDRFWYENTAAETRFTTEQLDEIKTVTLAQIMCLTLGWEEIQRDVFVQSSEKRLCRGLVNRFPDIRNWNI